MVCLLCDFKILLTVFNQSYSCQTSHYLGRNRLPKPFLILPSLVQCVSYKAAEAMMVTKINEAFVSNAVWGHQRVCNWLAKITRGLP